MKRLTSIFSIFFVFLLFVNSELCSQPPFRIGIVLSLGGLFDRSFNDATYVGIQKLRQNKNLLIDVFEPSDIKAIENGIEYFCHQNLDLIIGVGIFSNDPIRIASEKYPKQKFVILDSVVSSPNVL
ncbi:BMP family ABC transporter substrate-binding protein, partial [bacterium]|nr:BMP family ABC transporter substrate-binding protein [bacterium]